jgi:predicted O-linked N-acetylglucosamine transferase (SPINDLY family)
MMSSDRPPVTLAETLEDLLSAFREDRQQRSAAIDRARALVAAGSTDEADEACRIATSRYPHAADAWQVASLQHARRGAARESVDALRRAFDLEPMSARIHHAIGQRLRDPLTAAHANEVFADLRAASDERSAVSDGNAAMRRADLPTAVACFTDAARQDRSDQIALTNLAIAYELSGDAARAALWQGLAAASRGASSEAIDPLRCALAADVGEAEAYLTLGDCCRSADRHEDARAAYEDGVRRWPDDVRLYAAAASQLQALGRTDDALALAERGLARRPHDTTLRQIHALMLPALYDTPGEIARWRARYAQGLDRLIEDTSLVTVNQVHGARRAVALLDNFFLPYQGQNDRDLQQRYGAWTARIMAASRPDLRPPDRSVRGGASGRIRLAYVSAHCHQHVVANFFLGWLRHADRTQFEITCYHVGTRADRVTERFRRHSDHFAQIPDVDRAADAILAARHDIVVHLDIGMDAATASLAALRLAPVQCAAWGHPTTTGLPTIDWFLSVDGMEPDDADAHYTERLLRLPGIGVAYEATARPAHIRSRSSFGLSDDRPILLCCQSPFKYLPQYDAWLVSIARRLPQAVFVFIAGHPVAGRLERRLSLAFAAHGLDFAAHGVFLPRLSWPDYLSLMCVSDLFLDTMEWSGGHSSLDAIAMGLPIVTRPCGPMRGHQSAGFLRQLGVTETIAADEQGYVDRAIHLATDRSIRDRVSARMLDRHAHLFDDPTPVRALERFYFDRTLDKG